MAETAATPIYYQCISSNHPLQPSSMKETRIFVPPTSNTNVTETSLIDSANSHCLHRKTRKVTKFRHSAFVWAFMLCCFAGCVLCSFIPFCLEAFKIQEVYCIQCKKKISSVPRKAKHAHIFLTLLFLVGLGFVIYGVFRLVSNRHH